MVNLWILSFVLLIFSWTAYLPAAVQRQYYASPLRPSLPNPTYTTGFTARRKESYNEYLETPQQDNPFHDKRIVDSKGKYTLEWTLDYQTKLVTFNVTVKTTGWVGIGFSKDGTMRDADIIIGWVGANGRGYLQDLYADYDRRLSVDNQQNWKLVAASETSGETRMVVTRLLDTCDPNDYQITIDLLWVLWAYGETDEFEYHFDKRGSFRAYLLDPILKTPESHLENFRAAKEFNLVAGKTTTYLCSIHKAPRLLQKHHMVEIHPFFSDTLSADHTHHMFLYRCVPPPGKNAKNIFEPLLGFPGEECNFNTDHVIPMQLCNLITAGWAYGANPYVLPDSTGVPIGESPDEYYMLEVHYNNPEGLPLQVTSGFDVRYTNQLRANDGGYLLVAFDVFGVFMIPPTTPSFEVYGFCSEDCSKSVVPEGGFEIVSVLLHTHNTGKRIKLHHFRSGKELDWILKDDNYDPSYQQVRMLYKPRQVLPGDLLVVRCEYDNTKTTGTTLSGFSTQQEMCVAGLIISKRVPYRGCSSQNNVVSFIGVEAWEWDMNTGERIITAPPSLAGKPLIYAADNLTDWTKALRYELQQAQLTSPSTGSCPLILFPSPPTSTGRNHQEQEEDAALVQEEQQKLLGTIISSSEEFSNILTLAKGYGKDTLMGNNKQVPTKTPGPSSSAAYPYGAERYSPKRVCPRIIPPPFPSYYAF